MISFLHGTIEQRSVDSVVVAVGGIGLRALVPGSTLNRIGAVGDAIHLRTHLYMREDILALYGFATEEELQFFELLITVSGVGPRLALALLSGAAVDSLRLAIGTGNADLLTAIPGIGKKLAGRLILELKGKIDVRGLAPGTSVVATAQSDAEVLAALTNLGYTVQEAQRAIQALPSDDHLATEDRIIAALKYFAG